MNENNGEAWRMFGYLFQENDKDEFSLVSFINAYELNNLDL